MAKPVWTAERTGRALVKSLLPVRSRLAHKGDFGKVLLLCGSKGLAGAAMLAARAALRTGSGIVYLGVPEAIYSICAGACASAVVFPRGSFLWMQSGRSKRGFPAWTRSYLAAASGSRRSCGFF